MYHLWIPSGLPRGSSFNPLPNNDFLSIQQYQLAPQFCGQTLLFQRRNFTMKARSLRPLGAIRNSEANFGFNPGRRLKGKGLLLSLTLPLFLFLLGLTTTCIVQPAEAESQIDKGKSVCAKAGQGSLLEQICALDGSSKKKESRFDHHLLTGGSTARLVIGREFKTEEKLEFKGLMVWDLADHISPTVTTIELRILSMKKKRHRRGTRY